MATAGALGWACSAGTASAALAVAPFLFLFDKFLVETFLENLFDDVLVEALRDSAVLVTVSTGGTLRSKLELVWTIQATRFSAALILR